MKLLYYKNAIPRKNVFSMLFTSDCIVFMFKKFDVSLWWGDNYQDMDYTGGK